MQDPWNAILSKLNLSRAEQAAVKRFEQDPNGRSFLPVADILRSHRKIEESLELLTQGVERHPGFTVARVVLARELFAKGMVAQAWYTLEATTQSLEDNVLAQKLRFKLALLIAAEDVARDIARHLQAHHMHDDETKTLTELLRTASLAKAKDRLIADLRSSGITPLIPRPEDINGLSPAATVAAEAPPVADTDDAGDAPEEDKLQNFHVLPLNEVFKGMEMSHASSTNSGLELDSTTLADLYCKQGHYGKAMAIYRRLLRMTPGSDYLKRRIREIVRLEKAQRADDLSIDPTVVDQMEALGIVDEQINFYHHLLARLESDTWQKR